MPHWGPLCWVNFSNFYTNCHIKKFLSQHSKTLESILSNKKYLKHMHTMVFPPPVLYKVFLIYQNAPCFLLLDKNIFVF